MLLKEFWAGKRVLITGHTGFKGSWLAIWLNELGANVAGYALDPYSPRDNFVICGISDKIIDIRGDVRDYGKVLSVFNDFKPQIVFHLAAQPLVGLSYQIPKETYDINVGGTVNVLEAIRMTDSVAAGVMVTSDKCYENKEWVWGYRESDSLGGFDPYSSSKGAAEVVISGYRNSFFNPVNFQIHRKAIASVRAGNVIGGGDWSQNRIIPDCIRALEQDIPIEIRNPNSIRPWQFVLEPLFGYIILAQKLCESPEKYSEAWNFGPDLNSPVSVKEIAEQAIKFWGRGTWVDTSDRTTIHESSLLTLDCNKAKMKLGWHPNFNAEKAIEMTVAWYKKAWKDKYTQNMYDFCVEQIQKYSEIYYR